MTRRLAFLVVLLVTTCAVPALAQSTAFGRLLYAPDRWWTAVQVHNPWTREIDNTEEKSAATSGVITELGGYALSKVTPLSFRHGRQAVASLYVLRAAYGLSSGETKRYRAHIKHITAVSAAAFLHVEVRF